LGIAGSEEVEAAKMGVEPQWEEATVMVIICQT
jgi:hypothetical protein